MKNSLILVSFISIFLLGVVKSKKRHVGPCLVVTEPEPCPDPDYIKIYLFTRKNADDGQYVEFNETSDNLTYSNFVPINPNKLIIHGFNADMDLNVLQDIKTEYLKQFDGNIWMINYPKLVETSFCYLFAVQNIKHVGKCLTQLVDALLRKNSTDIHVVGFSLGAHVANYLANNLGEYKLDRITGLDPAGPLFTLMDKKNRLDASDAKFVDVIHTNGLMQGDIERCGHIDFYMNGGVTQPGCFDQKDGFLNCNHRRAPEYFAESINTKVGFLAWQCESYTNYIEGKCKPKLELVPVGEHCPLGGSGFYVAYTAAEKPFALGNWTSESYEIRLPKTGFTKRQINKEPLGSKNHSLRRIFPEIFLINK